MSPGFMDESQRCRECGQMPPDHDPICPYNPAFRTEVDLGSLKETLHDLQVKLDELEASCDPNFDAIGELIAKIESLKSYLREAEPDAS